MLPKVRKGGIQKDERNKSIVLAFTSRQDEAGIKSSLAKEFGLSSRTIDRILEGAGIDHKLTKDAPM